MSPVLALAPGLGLLLETFWNVIVTVEPMTISPLLALAPGPGLLLERLWNVTGVAACAGAARAVAATAAPAAAAAAIFLAGRGPRRRSPRQDRLALVPGACGLPPAAMSSGMLFIPLPACQLL
jgi:hypothetical protein